jgi:hypothetical protein
MTGKIKKLFLKDLRWRQKHKNKIVVALTDKAMGGMSAASVNLNKRISVNELLGLKKQSETYTKELLNEAKKLRKKQPQSWVKQKYRRAAELRQRSLDKTNKARKPEFIEEETSDGLDFQWQRNMEKMRKKRK